MMIGVFAAERGVLDQNDPVEDSGAPKYRLVVGTHH